MGVERDGDVSHLVDVVECRGRATSHALMRAVVVYLGHLDEELILVLVLVGGWGDLRVEDLWWV